MPYYDYRCNRCKTVFSLRRSFEQVQDVAPCPACANLLTERILSVPAVVGKAQAPKPASQSNKPVRRHGYDCICCTPRRRR